MTLLKPFLTAGLCGAVLLGLGSVASDMSATAATADETIKARQAKMKELGGHLKAIRGLIGSGGTAEIQERAAAVKAIGDEMPAWFPDGTLIGDAGVTVETEALQTISEKRAGFDQIAAAMSTESVKLAEAAQGGDPAAIGAQFGAMAKASCGACHEVYRVKK